MTGSPQILAPTPDHIKQAAAALHQGQLVGMPTETVYGLAASIKHEAALAAVFTYKQRPFEDPLIVHVLEARAALALWDLDARTLPLVQCLMENFWPGPLTLVARAQPSVSRLVRGGGDAVGVRSPRHPVARALIEAAGVPVAAPSANLFGHVSPTRAQHVADDFYDRSLLILDGDRSAIGIESTVMKIEDDGSLRLLRHGGVSGADILMALDCRGLRPALSGKEPGRTPKKVEAPGQYLRHYAPHTPAWMLSPGLLPAGYEARDTVALKSVACVDFGGRFADQREAFARYRDLSPTGSAAEAAQGLFEELRALERMEGPQQILLPELDPHQAEQQALYDRIYRACEGKRAALHGTAVQLT